VKKYGQAFFKSHQFTSHIVFKTSQLGEGGHQVQ